MDAYIDPLLAALTVSNYFCPVEISPDSFLRLMILRDFPRLTLPPPPFGLTAAV